MLSQTEQPGANYKEMFRVTRFLLVPYTCSIYGAIEFNMRMFVCVCVCVCVCKSTLIHKQHPDLPVETTGPLEANADAGKRGKNSGVLTTESGEERGVVV